MASSRSSRAAASRSRWLAAAVAAHVAAVQAVPASAQPLVPPEQTLPAVEPPWAQGISADRRVEARRLLERGNQAFLAARLAEALAAYQQALDAWDHPAIHFNLVRVLVDVGRPVEAYRHLERALRFGSAPLEDAIYAEALAYARMLREQIATVEIRCTQPDVKITVDGQAGTTCPGVHRAVLAPGTHQIVAQRADHLTLLRELVAPAGSSASLDVELLPAAEATTSTRRWAAWKPWAAFGVGVALGGAGVLMLRDGGDDEPSPPPPGEGEMPPEEDSPGAALPVGSVVLVAGGAIAIAGLTLAILNRRTVQRHPAERSPMRVVPAATGDALGASLVGRF